MNIPPGKTIESAMWLIGACLILAVLIFCQGCLDKEARAAIEAANNKTAVALNATKNDAKIAKEKAKEASDKADQAALNNPILHPIRCIGISVRENRPVFNRFALIFTFLGAASFAVMFAAKFVSLIGELGSSLAKFFGIVFTFMAIVFWVLLWFGPVAPWIALALLIIAFVLLLIRLHNNKRNIGKLFNLHTANARKIQSVAAQTGATVPLTPAEAKAVASMPPAPGPGPGTAEAPLIFSPTISASDSRVTVGGG